MKRTETAREKENKRKEKTENMGSMRDFFHEAMLSMNAEISDG